MLKRESEKIIIRRPNMDYFGHKTGDDNNIHFYLDAALKFNFGGVKFTNTPVMGAHLGSIGEQFSYRILDRLKAYWTQRGEDCEDIKIIGIQSKIGAPVYPDDKLKIKIDGFREENNYVSFTLIGTVRDQQAVKIKTKCGIHYNSMPPWCAPVIQKSEDKLSSLNTNELPKLYSSLISPESDLVPHMFPPSTAVKTLLRYLEEKTGEKTGLNMTMDFDFMSRPQLGTYQVDIFRPRGFSPERSYAKGDGHAYKTRIICSQIEKSVPLSSGTITIVSPHPIDFEPTV